MDRISWHPAFFGAMKFELDEYRNVLEFKSEYPLTSEPLKIDVLIIKKRRNIEIKKNIARIFQKFNIVEYKSQTVSVTIYDYYKTQAYSYLYSVFNRVKIKNLSLTIIATRRPSKLLNELAGDFGISLVQDGIYSVKHSPVKTQIVVSSELPNNENLWLTSLKTGITREQLKKVITEIVPFEKDPVSKAYFETVAEANFNTIQKLWEDEMSLVQRLKDGGYLDKWFAKEIYEKVAGERERLRAEEREKLLAEEREKVRAEERERLRAEERIETARKLIHLGVVSETIAKATGLPLKEVKRLK
ncbi:MAG: hypothetical protein LBT09_09770 [Planctomycetaceae bacterium]|jgi:hypothetical protein|nr:hypothetical protein [Planctomycetaceae bacterium]